MREKGGFIVATIKRVVHTGDKPTAEAVEEIRRARSMPIVYDEDSPELTDEDYARMAEAARVQRTGDQRVPVSLRIKRRTLAKAKATGKGYTGFLSRLIDNAIEDEELVKKSL